MSSLRPTMNKIYRSHSSAKAGIPTDNDTSAESAGNSPAPNHSNGATEATSLLQRHAPNVPKYYDDERPWVSYPAAFLHTTWQVVSSNYSNVLLVFVPLGLIAGLCKWDPVVTFCLNFLAIVPLAALLSFATEEISAKLGQTIGGLMNATFGNAVELIVSIIALYQGQIRIVQASMLGSILSNMLLVLGCCFIAGGVRMQGQQGHFDVTVASTMSSLMAVASACLIIPATLYAAIARADGDDGDGKPGRADENTIVLSRGTAIIMLCLYVLYLFFQLKSHAFLFDEEAQQQQNDAERGADGNEEEESDEPQEGEILKPIPASICLVIVTVLVSFCADFLVDSIDPIVERAHISKTFIGLILIPIVGNAAEHVTAVVVSWKGKMNLALGVAIGSSMQIALFVTPFLVILGWAIGVPMTLHFQGFETVVFFLSVLVVNYLIQDGKSNYLEGCMCLGTYIIIALAFYVYPDSGTGAENINEMFKHFFDPVKG